VINAWRPVAQLKMRPLFCQSLADASGSGKRRAEENAPDEEPCRRRL
jgi:hypothetical protein